MRSIVAVMTLGMLAFSISCGDGEPPRSPRAAEPPPPVASSRLAPVESAKVTPEAAPEARRRRPLEVYSACGDVVTVVFADDPKAADAGRRTIAPSSAIEGPRGDGGTQTVWLLDASGEPLLKVRVTRAMRRVEIGKSCRTLDAR